jgi:hypothetical protein
MLTLRSIGSSLVSLLLVLSAVSVNAATITVSVTADELAVDGNCGLREAIIAANTDSAVDRCLPGAGADTIVVPPGTYTLALLGPNEDAARTGDLDIAGAIVIRGSGAATTIIEGDSYDYWLADRVLHILRTGALTLSGATIRGGLCGSGAGILNVGTLSVQDSRIYDNTAAMWFDNCHAASDGVFDFGGAGILNAPTGSLIISGSAVSANSAGYDDAAGGLLNYGQAQVEHTVLRDNSSAAGGAIVNLGTLDVADSLISGNGARFNGAALVNLSTATVRRTAIINNTTDHSGGAVENGTWSHPAASLRLDTSTVSGNIGYYGTGSIINYEGQMEISTSTVADNDGGWSGFGGVTSYAQTSLSSTIMANAGGNCAGPMVSLGNNLDTDGSCGLNASGDLPSTDPQIGPLADNGGFTPTHALLPGSPAIDHIPTIQCGAALDQRRVARPHPRRGFCDVGAYEFSPPGDIHLIIEDVRLFHRTRSVTGEQQGALIQTLKSAALAATKGDSGGACAAIDDFASAVSAYVNGGSLGAYVGQALLTEAARVRLVVCPQASAAGISSGARR